MTEWAWTPDPVGHWDKYEGVRCAEVTFGKNSDVQGHI